MDASKVRKDFALLAKKIDGKRVVYLDSACQTLRPRQVVEAMARYYDEYPACAGRSVHKLATSVAIEVDLARERVAELVNARSREEVCFMKNCTEALNTVLFGIGLKSGDAVLTTDREHNSMHIPLLTMKNEAGIRYERVPSREDGSFDIVLFSRMLRETKAKLVAMCHTSNVNGTTVDAKEISKIAHEEGALVLFDGAQHVPCGGVDIRHIDADFYAFSCHKMCGPSGVGVLAGKLDMLSVLRPLIYGGHAVSSVTSGSAELMPPPERFEAGLQNYAGMIGAGVAADYIRSIGRDEISAHVNGLNAIATRGLREMPSVEILEPHDAGRRGGILGFNIKGYGPHDIAMMLDHSDNVMIRSGMHCAHTWFEDRKMPGGSARASFYIYNDREDADTFVAAVRRIAG